MKKTAETKPSPQFRGDSLRPNSATDRTHRARRRGRRPGVITIAVIAGLLIAPWGISMAHAEEASEPANGRMTVPPPKDGKKAIVVRVQVTQPYIDKVATKVTYNGMDRVFGIEWKIGKLRGKLRVPDAAVIDEKIVSDILDDTNAGVSVPARYTPVTTPRLFPYLTRVREIWGQQFNDMAHASTKIVAIAMVTTLRPTTSPLTARTAATPKPAPSKPDVPQATVVNTKPKIAPTTAAAAATVKRSSIWSLPIFKRGRLIEKILGANLAKNFPTIDRWKNGIATSIKSLDLGAKSYQKASRLKSKVRGYINKVAKFNGRVWAGQDVPRNQIKGRALDLVVPTAGTAAQQAALKKLIEYGRSVGVKVNIIVYP